MYIILQLAISGQYRPPAIFIYQKQIAKPLRNNACYFVQRKVFATAGRAFYFKIIAIVIIKALQAFYYKIVYRHPYRATPVAVAAKQTCSAFARRIFNRKFSAMYP